MGRNARFPGGKGVLAHPKTIRAMMRPCGAEYRKAQPISISIERLVLLLKTGPFNPCRIWIALTMIAVIAGTAVVFYVKSKLKANKEQ
jgi:hypothetical protein